MTNPYPDPVPPAADTRTSARTALAAAGADTCPAGTRSGAARSVAGPDSPAAVAQP